MIASRTRPENQLGRGVWARDWDFLVEPGAPDFLETPPPGAFFEVGEGLPRGPEILPAEREFLVALDRVAPCRDAAIGLRTREAVLAEIGPAERASLRQILADGMAVCRLRQPRSLLRMIWENGGIWPGDPGSADNFRGELEQIGLWVEGIFLTKKSGPHHGKSQRRAGWLGRPGIVRRPENGGRGLDDLAVLAVEAGYFFETPTHDELVEAIRREMADAVAVFGPDGEYARELAARTEALDELCRVGIDAGAVWAELRRGAAGDGDFFLAIAGLVVREAWAESLAALDPPVAPAESDDDFLDEIPWDDEPRTAGPAPEDPPF